MVESAKTREPIFEALHRFFVGLCLVTRQADGSEKTYCRSGFLLKLKDEYLWVTAGHVIERILADLDRGAVLEKAFLADDGDEFTDMIHFDFHRAGKLWIHQDGVDVAAILLHELYWKALLRDGVTPIEVGHISLSKWEEGFCYVLGAPEEWTEDIVEDHEPKVLITPVVWRLKRLPDETLEGHARRLRFDAQDNVIMCLGRPQESMEGMSGGPIFAHRRSEDGASRFYAVGIQSSWLPQQKIVFGSPLYEFAAHLYELIERDERGEFKELTDESAA